MKIESIIEMEMLWDETGKSMSFYTVFVNSDHENLTWTNYNLKACTDAEIHSILKNIGSGIFTAKMEIEILEQFLRDAIFDNIKINTILDGLQFRNDLLAVAIDFLHENGYLVTQINRL